MFTEFVMPFISDLPSGPIAVSADMPGTSEFVVDHEKIPSNAGMARTHDAQASHAMAMASFSAGEAELNMARMQVPIVGTRTSYTFEQVVWRVS